jgi:hypothetical protein
MKHQLRLWRFCAPLPVYVLELFYNHSEDPPYDFTNCHNQLAYHWERPDLVDFKAHIESAIAQLEDVFEGSILPKPRQLLAEQLLDMYTEDWQTLDQDRRNVAASQREPVSA